MRRQVIIIGAGMAGLSAARLLSTEHDVIVLDKGRGVGGRMATRRIGDATLDHGAEFVTAHTDEFAEIVRTWVDAGAAQPWFAGPVGPHGAVHGDGDGHPRYRGAPTMNAIARHLATGLDVRTSTPVRSVRSEHDGWVVSTPDGDLRADAVLLTPPVPQSMALLEAGGVVLDGADADSLLRVEYDPCIAVLAVLEGPTLLPEPGAVRFDTGPIAWMADNQRKGTSVAPAVTMHTTGRFARDHWDTPDDVVVETVLAAATLPGRPLPGLTQVHRWRYAKPVVSHPERCLAAQRMPTLVFAGDAFGGASVETAVLSGHDAARHLR